MNERFPNSAAEFERALKVVAEGTTQTRAPALMAPCDYPIFSECGKGARIWDIDGNCYLDWILSFGCIVLGHSHPVVNAAAIEQIEKGHTQQLPPVLQNDLAEKLVELIPCAEKTLFLKTGSDATTAAVRVARLVTGRDKIIRLGYNGWHDWCCKVDPGIPQDVLDLTLKFNYNDLDSLAAVFEANSDEICGVIMWACEVEEPQPGFLEGVRDLCHQHGALFIMDEVRTGFHFALGGAQEYFGVTPDLATFGKAMSNGYPISALVGPAEYMDTIGQTWMSSTHCTNAIEYAAALATIRFMEENDVIATMWDIGRKLIDGQNALARDIGVDIEAVGLAPTPDFAFHYDDPGTARSVRKVFFEAVVDEGVFFHANHHGFVCAVHTDADVEESLAATAAGYRAVKEAI